MGEATVRAVLFGDADPAGAIGASPGWAGVMNGLGAALGQVSTNGRSTVEREMTGALSTLLGLDLGEVIIAGWRSHRALVAAAQATQDNPSATEVVQLATHQIATGHRPYVDVIVNGVKLATVHFDLSLSLDIDAVLATVRGGRLVAIQSGRCTVTATLSCEGHQLASRKAKLDPVATVRLGQGLALQ
jgi:hypothetical protein